MPERIGGLLGIRRAANPTLRDRIANGLLGEEPSELHRDAVRYLIGSQGVGRTNFSAADVVPLLGPAMNGQEDYRDGNYKGVALNALSAVPAVGGLRGLLSGVSGSVGFHPAMQWASRAGIGLNRYLTGQSRPELS